jgi:hypothetical protein
MVFKLAAIIGGVLLMAGVALAGTLTSLDSTNSPTVGTTPPPAVSTVRQDDRGQENEARGRANEPGEDVRGPCDELEHANDPRCTGAAPVAGNGDVADDRGQQNEARGRGNEAGEDVRGGHEDSGRHEDSSGRGDNSGHGGGNDD